MQKSVRTIWRLAGGTGGTEIAEAAMILPLLFVVLMAIFWFGQAFRIYGTLTRAAREGARAAVAPACTTCTATTPTQNAITAVTSAMAAAHMSTAQLQPWGSTWNPPTLCSCGSSSSSCGGGSAVACDGSVSGNNVCVQPNVQLSYNSVLGAAGTCGTSVSMGYKYSIPFTLPCFPAPCTSMDLSKMTLTGQAEMRLETQ
ncbi:MAG: TadE family protein [Candidatus Sulfotelmatobacter sp.]|jgi:Flp pilus assembly protein TadG